MNAHGQLSTISKRRRVFNGDLRCNFALSKAKRQQRKLNFLITQTELYAHFIGKKLTGEADQSAEILQKLEDAPLQREVRPGVVVNLETPEDYDSEAAKARALANVQSAFQKQQSTVRKKDPYMGSV